VYYYHGDHLGSAQVVTDYRGDVYEHIEYTPYGELWVEHAPNVEATPFRFTGKERDSETGLYYYGARYLNPQTSMWLSTDPAMGEYIPQAPLNDEARKYNQNLPGMGGVFNTVNLHVYHYAGNNPVRYTDPTGLSDEEIDLLQKAANYLKSECEKYIESLKQEAYASGRATASIGFATTINGVKVKGSFTGIVEYDSKGEFSFVLEAGLDIGLGTPGQELVSTGAEVTVGLRASFGIFENKQDSMTVGLRSISFAMDMKVEVLGVGTKIEFRRQIVNFDTPTGRPEFTLFGSDTSKIGVSASNKIGIVNVGGGVRVNGF
jgi:RHS repeat-associated protein